MCLSVCLSVPLSVCLIQLLEYTPRVLFHIYVSKNIIVGDDDARAGPLTRVDIVRWALTLGFKCSDPKATSAMRCCSFSLDWFVLVAVRCFRSGSGRFGLFRFVSFYSFKFEILDAPCHLFLLYLLLSWRAAPRGETANV